MILEVITTKLSESWYFQNVVCLFWAVNITGDTKSFNFIKKNCQNLYEILYISGNTGNTKKGRPQAGRESQAEENFRVLFQES